MFEPCLLYPQKRTSETSLRAAQTAKPSAGTQPTVVGRVVERADYRWKSNVARRYKANNSVPIIARQTFLWSGLVGQIPDDSLTNRIFGFDYGLWRYWIPLPFDGNPILTLPDVVASAVTISVRATHNPFGDRIFSNHSRISGGTFLNCPRSIAAPVALTAQNMSVAMRGLALEFLSVALRSEYLRNMNFQTAFAVAICLSRLNTGSKKHLHVM